MPISRNGAVPQLAELGHPDPEDGDVAHPRCLPCGSCRGTSRRPRRGCSTPLVEERPRPGAERAVEARDLLGGLDVEGVGARAAAVADDEDPFPGRSP